MMPSVNEGILCVPTLQQRALRVLVEFHVIGVQLEGALAEEGTERFGNYWGQYGRRG